jgi:nucleoid DNA-binding protein
MPKNKYKHEPDFVCKKEFVALMSKACGDSHVVCGRNFNAFLAVIRHIVGEQGRDFLFTGVGKLTFKYCFPRMQYNPKTHATHLVPSHKRLYFKPNFDMRRKIKFKSIAEKDVDNLF